MRRSEPWLAAGLAAALVWASAPPAATEERPLTVVDERGKVVPLTLGDEGLLVVHFWATWCPECVRELPALEATGERCAPRVRIAFVNVAESLAAAAEFRASRGLRAPLLRDPDGALWRRFARGLPANVIWTREGRRVVTGPYATPEWAALLASHGCPRDGSP